MLLCLPQKAWSDRIEPYISGYPSSGDEMVSLVLDNPDYAMYRNYFGAR